MLCRSLATLIVMLLMPLAADAQETPPDLRTISVQGDAVIYVPPDEAVIAIGIDMFAKTIDEAKAANDRAAKSVLEAVRALGIEEKHIGTEEVRVSIDYRTGRAWEGIGGFIVSRTYVVTLKDVKKLESLIDATLKAGANRMSDVSFRTTEVRKHRDRARVMAMQAASEKAAMLARSLNCEVGAPRSISEGDSGVFNLGWRGRAQMAQNFVQNDGGAEGDELAPPGQIMVRANVSVTFDLRPNKN